MKLVFYTFYIFFLYPQNTFAALDSITEKVDAVTAKIKEVEALPIIQDVKKVVGIMTDEKTGLTLTPVQTDIAVKMDVCIECDDIIKLTDSVNKVLEKMTKDNPNSYAALESGNLVALTEVIRHVNLETNKVSCFVSNNTKYHEDFINFDKEDLVPIFTSKENLKFTSIQFRNTTGDKTVWLRGKDEDIDKVVKVYFDQYGDVHITYYNLKKPTLKNIKILSDNPYNLPDLGGVPPDSKKKNLATMTSGDLNWNEDIAVYENENTQISAKLGSSIEYEYFIPTRVTLVDFETSIKSGDTKISSDVEIATDIQQATVKVSQNQFTGSATVNLEREFEVGAGIKVDVIDDLTLDTYTTYNSSSALSINSKFSYKDEQLFTSSYERDSNGQQKYSISKDKMIDKNTTFSVKVEKTIPNDLTSSNNTVWLNFTKKF